MSAQFSAPNPLDVEILSVLQALADRAEGRASPGRLERHLVDLKEEAGRRGPQGQVLAGDTQNERAANALVEEVACMANTPGGGALVVGAADNGDLIGTNLDTEWLRHRLYELTKRRVTVDARAVTVAGARLVVLRMVEAVEPVRHDNRIRWRVDDHCVEIDAATWHDRHLNRIGFDWSAQPSTHPVTDVRATAVQVARDYLRASNEPKALDLADATDADLLRRLNVVTPDGSLTNAGALVFVGRSTPTLDYLRRDVAGGDSRVRLNEAGRSVLEELYEVERTIAAYNPVEHVGDGLAIGQLPRLPPRAVREAIVNGLAHRDWATELATVVEHVGTSLVVWSPGGFVEGVNADNLITHPSQSRNTALTTLFAALRVADREGVGVDRMMGDMIRVGLAPPVFEQVAGPRVRTALVGGSADRAWLDFLRSLTPIGIADDLDVLILLRLLAENGWFDAASAAPVMQRNLVEADAAIGRLDGARIAGRVLRDLAGTLGRPLDQPVGSHIIQRIDGVPVDTQPAWCWAGTATRTRLHLRGSALTSVEGRRRVATRYAHHRGRISTTELASITGVASQQANRTMKDLEEQGVLQPGRAERAGRGFFYIPAD